MSVSHSSLKFGDLIHFHSSGNVCIVLMNKKRLYLYLGPGNSGSTSVGEIAESEQLADCTVIGNLNSQELWEKYLK